MKSSDLNMDLINDQVKESTRVIWDSRPTRIIALAIATEDDDRNSYVHVSTSYGRPLTPPLHDQVRDHYEICCADHLHIGTIPFSLQMEMQAQCEWIQQIPIPESVIQSHLEKSSWESFEEWKKLYPEDEYDIEFMQMIGCY